MIRCSNRSVDTDCSLQIAPVDLQDAFADIGVSGVFLRPGPGEVGPDSREADPSA